MKINRNIETADIFVCFHVNLGLEQENNFIFGWAGIKNSCNRKIIVTEKLCNPLIQTGNLPRI